MVVCICNAINDSSLRKLIKENRITALKQIHKFGVCDQCKKCCKEVKKIIHEQNIH